MHHLGDGRWWDEDEERWRDGQGRRLRMKAMPVEDDPTYRSTRVILATAHLDHDPTNNDARNLKAFCQRCHMIQDKQEHLRRRRLTFLLSRAIGDLFTGMYRP